MPTTSPGGSRAPEIVPLGSAPPASAIAYLSGGGMPEAVIRWKYFDADFNRGRERGFCAFADGEMVGFIGMIPVTLKRREEVRHDHWMCDWSIGDPRRDKGLGGLLASKALETAGRAIAYGGTEAAKKRWRLKANAFDLDAGRVYRKHLRLGSCFGILQRRGLMPDNRLTRLAGKVRLHWPRGAGDAVIVKGVDPSTAALFRAGEEHWRATYDQVDLHWQLESCPEVEAWTSVAADAAVLFWRSTRSSDAWKLVPLGRPEAFRPCLIEAIRHILRAGGLSAMVQLSSADQALIRCVRALGFGRTRTTHPIFFLGPGPEQAPETLEGISFLASDEGHRF